jgi:hypothetical protein
MCEIIPIIGWAGDDIRNSLASFIMLSRSNGSCQQKYQQSGEISQ